MKCDYCKEVYRTGRNSITVKEGRNIILHFCEKSCLEQYFYEKYEQTTLYDHQNDDTSTTKEVI